MDIRFWGVRGSVAVSGVDVLRTGGNTSCVELRSRAGQCLVLDAGTGLRALGQACPVPLEAPFLLSHVHWDHIQGLPFFRPAYHPSSRLRLCGAGREWGGVREGIAAQMRPPAFPIGLDAFRAELDFVCLEPGRAVRFGDFEVVACELSHPNGSMAYRVTADGRSVVYATDNELGIGDHGHLEALCAGADLLVHDAQYVQDELDGRRGPSRRGFGHSTWDEAVQLAERAQVGAVALFHHDPARTDDDVAVIEAQARGRFRAALAAREGLVVGL